MPVIKIDGTLHVSHELFSRLRLRGYITSSGSCTEDLIYLMQEALIRDEGKTQVSVLPDPELKSQNEDKTEEPQRIQPQPQPTQTSQPVDLANLRSSISNLYGG